MSSEIEVAGSLAEASIVANSVDAIKTGATAKNSEHMAQNAGHCLNCNANLIGSHCHACGQSAHIHRSFSAFWHDILHGVLHFDGKFWNTLPLLAWHPGTLTRRYIHGERAKFISPMAIFLFAIFMMFAVFSYIGSPDFSNADYGNGQTAQSGAERAEERAGITRQIDDTAAQLEAAQPGSKRARELQLQLDIAKTTINGIDAAIGAPPTYPEAFGADVPISINNGDDINSGVPWFDRWATNALKKANSNPELLIYKLQSNGYKFAWLLIPISIPFIWLVTIGARGHRFYDHAVFVTYSLAFMSLLFIAVALAVKFAIMPGLITTLAILYAPFHIYRQLRHAYNLSRISAMIRFVLLFFCIIIAIIVFLLLLLTLGLLSG